MKTNFLFVSVLLLLPLFPVSAMQPNKHLSREKQDRREATPKTEEFNSPDQLSIDSTAVGILDGKIISFKMVKELSRVHQIRVIEPLLPKDAILQFGEKARGGALRCVTVKD